MAWLCTMVVLWYQSLDRVQADLSYICLSIFEIVVWDPLVNDNRWYTDTYVIIKIPIDGKMIGYNFNCEVSLHASVDVIRLM